VRRAIGKVMAVVLPWPTRQQRRDAISAARDAKEKSLAAAAQAEGLRAQAERAAREIAPGGRPGLRVLLGGQPTGRADCPVLQSGQLADCPVFISGRLAE
jgi:hypothetical protein